MLPWPEARSPIEVVQGEADQVIPGEPQACAGVVHLPGLCIGETQVDLRASIVVQRGGT